MRMEEGFLWAFLAEDVPFCKNNGRKIPLVLTHESGWSPSRIGFVLLQTPSICISLLHSSFIFSSCLDSRQELWHTVRFLLFDAWYKAKEEPGDGAHWARKMEECQLGKV